MGLKVSALAWMLVTFVRLQSQAASGKTGADFLSITVGAREIGMGEAGTALAEDANAAFWNPAGLRQLKMDEVSFMHTQWVQGVNYEYGSYVHPSKIGALGLGFHSLSSGGLQGYDANDNPTGIVNAGDLAAVGSYASVIALWDHPVYWGGSLKYLKETLDTFQATSYAGDAGLLTPLPSPKYFGPQAQWKMGLAVQNLGSGFKFEQTESPLPQTFRVGSSLSTVPSWDHSKGKATMAADLIFPRYSSPGFAFGSEYIYEHLLALRLGYKWDSVIGNGLRFGLGVLLGHLTFDYAFAGYGDLGFTQRVGIMYKFDHWGAGHKAGPQESGTLPAPQQTPSAPVEHRIGPEESNSSPFPLATVPKIGQHGKHKKSVAAHRKVHRPVIALARGTTPAGSRKRPLFLVIALLLLAIGVWTLSKIRKRG